MIVFELVCAKHHRFEGWFASGDDFEHQNASGLLSCPACGAASVKKVPLARVQRAKAERNPVPAVPESKAPVPGTTGISLAAFIDHVLKSSEDVGDKFPEEARKIHYEEARRRSIRGVASPQETEELLEEGISILPLPIPPKGDWH